MGVLVLATVVKRIALKDARGSSLPSTQDWLRLFKIALKDARGRQEDQLEGRKRIVIQDASGAKVWSLSNKKLTSCRIRLYVIIQPKITPKISSLGNKFFAKRWSDIELNEHPGR